MEPFIIVMLSLMVTVALIAHFNNKQEYLHVCQQRDELRASVKRLRRCILDQREDALEYDAEIETYLERAEECT